MHEAMKEERVVSALQPDEPFGRGKKLRSNHLYHKIVASIEVNMGIDGQETRMESRTDLDSHANMPVIGREALVVEQSGGTVEFSPFTPDYKPIKVEVVNAMVQYDAPLDGKEYMLAIRNALCVPSMNNNLIPLFIMREMELLSMNVPRYTVKTQPKKTRDIFSHSIAVAWNIFIFYHPKT